MSAPDLSQCANCRYSLKGLPRTHRCPECGLHYDEWTRIWRPRYPAWAYWTPLGMVLLVVGLDLDDIARGDWSGVLWKLIFVGPIIGFGVWQIRRANRKGRYAAITPEGVWMRTSDVETTVAWTEFSDAQAKARNKVVIACHDGRRILVEGIFGTADVGAFCQAAWISKRRYDPAVTDYDRQKWKPRTNDFDRSDHESGGEQENG